MQDFSGVRPQANQHLARFSNVCVDSLLAPACFSNSRMDDTGRSRGITASQEAPRKAKKHIFLDSLLVSALFANGSIDDAGLLRGTTAGQ